MGHTACTEPQCLYKSALYFTVLILMEFDIEEFCKELRSRFKFRLDEWFLKCAPKG
jgi:hypothetical protein